MACRVNPSSRDVRSRPGADSGQGRAHVHGLVSRPARHSMLSWRDCCDAGLARIRVFDIVETAARNWTRPKIGDTEKIAPYLRSSGAWLGKTFPINRLQYLPARRTRHSTKKTLWSAGCYADYFETVWSQLLTMWIDASGNAFVVNIEAVDK